MYTKNTISIKRILQSWSYTPPILSQTYLFSTCNYVIIIILIYLLIHLIYLYLKSNSFIHELNHLITLKVNVSHTYILLPCFSNIIICYCYSINKINKIMLLALHLLHCKCNWSFPVERSSLTIHSLKMRFLHISFYWSILSFVFAIFSLFGYFKRILSNTN